VALFFVVLWLSLANWTFTDADRRGAMRFYWGIMALIFPFIGTLVYIIGRPPEYLLDSRERELELAVLERELKARVTQCPNCRSVVEKEYLLCPECGWDLKKPGELPETTAVGLEYLPVLRNGAARKTSTGRRI
jgi:hypothetical protein